MPVFTVAAVADQTRDWASQRGGPMKSYRVQLRDAQGKILEAVELSQKAATDPPRVGQTLDGDIEQNGDFGLKFKKAFSQGVGGGRPKSPQEQAEIRASVAIKAAIEAVEQSATFGLTKVTTQEEHVALLKRYADWAFRYIAAKGQQP